jgi:hypothetical protein
MSIATALALLGMLAPIASGGHMVARPAAYLGKGTAPASDPRTVRWFGIVFLILGSASAALFVLQFVTE